MGGAQIAKRTVAALPQLALGEVHGDAAHLEALGANLNRLLAARQLHIHGRGERRALDGQDEAATGVAAGDLAGGRVGLLLPVPRYLSAVDGEVGGGVDRVVGTGAAQGLLDLSAALADSVSDGALYPLGAFAE